MKKYLQILKWIFIIISVLLFLQSQRYSYIKLETEIKTGMVFVHDKFLNDWYIEIYIITEDERYVRKMVMPKFKNKVIEK